MAHSKQENREMGNQVPVPELVMSVDNQLLQKESSAMYTGDGTVNLQGKPVLKSKTGKWKACFFILANECAERVAYYGIAINLVSYFTSKLHEGNVSAARNVSIWTGTCYLTPLIGAFLADAYWGRFRTIAVFSTIYFIVLTGFVLISLPGMCTLTLSASVSAFKPAQCTGSICPSATAAQYVVFFLGLYLIALGAGGIKPCVSSFGADQFDDTDPRERVKKGSFFNWLYFSTQSGFFLSTIFIVWIQDNVGWGIGFGIPALFMGIAVASFFAGTPLYRFQRPGGSPLTRMCQVVVASLHKWKLEVPQNYSLLFETSGEHSAIEGSRKLEHTDGLKCLDKASVFSDEETKGSDFSNPWKLCTVTQVEELKILIRMFPIWASTVVYYAVHSQVGTTFIEQGKAMDRRIGSLTIPAASLSILYVISAISSVLIYENILVAVVKKLTGKERGFSELQRIGIGLVLSIIAMVVAALVEARRLQLAKEHGLVLLRFYWQIPQYYLMGVADVFTYVGCLEFFYNQSPDAMRSVCTAFVLLMTTAGSYLNSLILTIVTVITTAGGKPGWISDNLNNGHLNDFFWLLAGLSLLNLLVYGFCALKYKPKKASSN